MNADQIATVRSTWSLLGATTDAVAPLFYDRLSQRAPELRSLFAHADVVAQGEKLTQTLAVIVRSLDDLNALLPAIAALGERHRTYGVLDAHYDVVSTVLLDTFAAVLGSAFTPAARDAWALALETLGHVMRAGALTPALELSNVSHHS